jgi:hypothetical protein
VLKKQLSVGFLIVITAMVASAQSSTNITYVASGSVTSTALPNSDDKLTTGYIQESKDGSGSTSGSVSFTLVVVCDGSTNMPSASGSVEFAIEKSALADAETTNTGASASASANCDSVSESASAVNVQTDQAGPSETSYPTTVEASSLTWTKSGDAQWTATFPLGTVNMAASASDASSTGAYFAAAQADTIMEGTGGIVSGSFTITPNN